MDKERKWTKGNKRKIKKDENGKRVGMKSRKKK